jgi:hypothetical protein
MASWRMASRAVVILLACQALVSCRSGPNSTPKPSPSPSVVEPTSTPSAVATSREELVKEVEDAYFRFWRTWIEASLTLDTTRLREVAMENALKTLESQIEEAKKKDQPVQVWVEHSQRVTQVTEETASLEDTYINHSVRLDPRTMQPIEPDPRQATRLTYGLTKVRGKWLVREIIRVSS